MYYAGIDLGTSAVKLLLMDEKGTIIRIVSREYPIYPHPGWSEQDPEDWYRVDTRERLSMLIFYTDFYSICKNKDALDPI